MLLKLSGTRVGLIDLNLNAVLGNESDANKRLVIMTRIIVLNLTGSDGVIYCYQTAFIGE